MDESIYFIVNNGTIKSRVDKFIISLNQDFSRSQIQKFIRANKLEINDKIINDPSYMLKDGDKVKLQEPNIDFYKIIPQKINLDILYEDQDILVLNKQKGLVVHPGSGIDDGTLVNALAFHCESLSNIGGITRAGIVHRLDRDTSGIMIIAKNNLAHENLIQQFANRTIKKTYKVLVWGNMSVNNSNQISLPIARNKNNREKMEVNFQEGKTALTCYKIIDILCKGNLSLIECDLHTGRTHQIRVHMEYIKHPIVGDNKYFKYKKYYRKNLDQKSKTILDKIPSQMLHSYSIKFQHPISKGYMDFSQDPPEIFQNIIQMMK